jgi:hypothetical protein
MPVTPEQRRAAQLAAQRLEAMLLEMLEAGEFGEVAVVVGQNYLTPEARPRQKGPPVKRPNAHFSKIEHVE